MSTNAKAVDVLAVMRDAELLASVARAKPEVMQRLEEARAAVADLVEAAKVARGYMGNAHVADRAHLDAALARIRGAA
jgi:hypothetical protein